MVDGVEGGHQRFDAMAAEIVHQLGDLVVGTPIEQRRQRTLVADIVHQPLAPRRAALEGQRRIELVRAAVDPVLQPLPTRLGEGRLLQRAVFQPHHLPAERLENRLDPLPQPLAHHPVERLPVIVDHPPAIAQVVLPALLQALIDVALVQLGIADQRDHPAERGIFHPAACGQIVLDQ